MTRLVVYNYMLLVYTILFKSVLTFDENLVAKFGQPPAHIGPPGKF